MLFGPFIHAHFLNHAEIKCGYIPVIHSLMFWVNVFRKQGILNFFWMNDGNQRMNREFELLKFNML